MTLLRFLLLEDSAIDADLIQAVLLEGEPDYELVQVQTRQDFIAAIAQHHFDLILADYSLPSFDGFSALQIAREHCPDVPFLFVSGTLGEEVAVEMLKSGATDYVLKQRLERLVPSVQRALKEAEERKARKHAEARLVNYADRLQMLAETSRIFAEAILDFQTLLDTVCRTIGDLIGEICILKLVSDDGQWLQIRAIHHPTLEAIALLQHLGNAVPQRVSEGLSAQVLQTQQSLRFPATTAAELRASVIGDSPYLEQFAVSSLMIAPLQVRGRSIGSLILLRETSDQPYTQDDQIFLQDLADRAALAIDNAHLYQKSQEANRIKDEFLAMLSHELRSPLNAIIGWLSLLRSRQFDAATTTRALETVERNARAQARLVEDLLDVSRVLQGKLRLTLRPLDLLPVVEAAIDTVRPTAEAKNIQLHVTINAQPEQISGDSERLQQVVWNLLTNAVKFTPAGGRVEVRLEQVDGAVDESCTLASAYSRHVQITITDTGQGIKSEFLPYVFDRFRQADSSITRMHGGLGLGLAIVRHLVDLHGGTVTADSAGEGKGATFMVKLPLLASKRDLQQSKPNSPEIDQAAPFGCPAQLNGLRVLIVDDDQDARILLLSILQECGAEVIAAASASEGLAALTSAVKPVHLLISDIGMPGEDGYTLLKQVRTLKPEQGGTIPAIAVTAYAREEDRQAAFSVGFQDHLAKPINPTQLIQLVANLIRQTQDSTKLNGTATHAMGL
ncbi:hybrid sensor histidine kinase/response regulator [Leptolyngbya ohadii]|uniref:hybrid sensor histidine kinase/response regulator n=1 Tax=Leptolyngbya ohadii TaxID=1962290 RepID=UPI0015C63854|nr:response regulator [Leptolyngbya ohadii]